MEISERIKELRSNTKTSQAELAKSIGVSSGNVGDWERGRAKPGADALVALMKFFGVSADYLLTGQKGPEEEKEEAQSSDSSISFTKQELEMIMKFRQLDYGDQQDTIDIIDMKYDRKLKRGMSSNSKTGGTGEEAATNEAV